jgi:type IV pilus assembly protein PilB
MATVDITDKIGFTLLKKGIIDYETLEKSLKVKESEAKRNRRNLGQILVHDFHADHDLVFKEVADLYAFREINCWTSRASSSFASLSSRSPTRHAV